MAKWNVSDKPAKVDLPAPAPSIADELAEALEGMIPRNLGKVPVAMSDDYTLPVDMTVGEIRKARAVLAKYRGMKK